MNNERFLKLLNSGLQADFTTLHEEITAYIRKNTKGLPDEVIEGAWDKVVTLLAAAKASDSWWHIRKIIDNYISDARRSQEIMPINLQPTDKEQFVDTYTEDFSAEEKASADFGWGWSGFFLTKETKGLKVRIDQIKDKKHKKIVQLYLQRLTQQEIAKKIGLSQGRVSQILDLYLQD